MQDRSSIARWVVCASVGGATIRRVGSYVGKIRVAAVCAAVLGLGLVTAMSGATPATWEHVGTGATPATASLNGAVNALDADAPGGLLVGGAFRDAGGVADADFVARWNGSAWSALGATPLGGAVNAIAARNGKIYVGGLFKDAGGNPNADYLAVWDGQRWAPACTGAPLANPVYALEVVGSTLYAGGTFQNAAGNPAADYLVACDTATGAPRATVGANEPMTGGGVYALAADSRGRLYAGGGFSRVAGIAAANKIAYLDGSGWHALGSGKASGGAALGLLVRSLAASGTTIYVGTDSVDIAGIPQADHVAKWSGSAWSALGSDTAGGGGWFPSNAFVYSLATSGSHVFAGGAWSNANGDPLADRIAEFDGQSWHSLGSSAGDGPFNGTVNALAVYASRLYAGGSFSNASGDRLARYLASLPLAAVPPLGGGPPSATATGTVTVGGRPFTNGAVPFGALVEITRGAITLTAATGQLRLTPASGVTAGFRLARGNDRGQPLVEIRLAGGDFSVCPKRKPSGVGGLNAGPKVVRSLWGDGKGRFRTKGRFASATVRGTNWLTSDRCDGTLTTVKGGVVEVRDIKKKKTVRVPAGKSYLATG